MPDFWIYSPTQSWSLLINFFLSDKDVPNLVWYGEVELARKTLIYHFKRTLLSSYISCVIFCRSSYISRLCSWVLLTFSWRGIPNSKMWTVRKQGISQQMTRSGHWSVNMMSAGKSKWHFKSTLTLQPVQPGKKKQIYTDHILVHVCCVWLRDKKIIV